MRIFFLLFSLTIYSYSLVMNVGDRYMVAGQMYEVTGYVSTTCSSSQNYPSITHVSGTQAKLNDTFSCNYGWQPIMYWGFKTVDGTCSIDSRGICYKELCSQDITIGADTYQPNTIDNLESCETDSTGASTGNVWRDAIQCSSSHGTCYQKNNCPVPVGFEYSTFVNDASECTVDFLNSSLPSSSSSINVVSEALYQDCSSTCWVKHTSIDCSTTTPFTPTLNSDETLYSSSIDVDACVAYASSNNLLYRHESNINTPTFGYSCWKTSHCIVRPMPDNCSNITIPNAPTLSENESFFGDSNTTQSQCTTYANSLGYSSRFISHVDPSTFSCYHNNYCIIISPGQDTNTTSSDNQTGNNNSDTNDTSQGNSTGTTNTDSNSTNSNNSNDSGSNTSLGEYNVILGQIDTSINTGNQDIKDAIDNIGIDIRTSSDKNHEDLSIINTSLNTVSDTLTNMNDFMQSQVNNNQAQNSMDTAKNKATSTINSISTSLNSIISGYTGTSPVVVGTGNHIFTATVYGSSIKFDLSMIERLKQYFDILWLLMLAYFNFRMYLLIIRDLLKKV